MTARDDDVVRRLDELIDAANDMARRAAGGEFYAELTGWRARAMTAISSIIGTAHPYFTAFNDDVPTGFASSVGNGAAILRALKTDVEAGYLRKEEDLVAAAVFTDFLDMAGYLLDGGYFHAAASLVGAVVEDALRRIAVASGVAVVSRDDINALSSKLREKGVFSPLVAKRVTMWAEVRNHADHGEWDKVTASDVHEMYRGVTAFMAERLGLARLASGHRIGFD